LRVGQSARMVPSIQQPSKDCESEVPTAAEPASATVSTCSSSENRDAISLNLASDPTSSMTTSFPMTQPESITLDIKRALRPQSDLSQLDCTNDLHLSFLDQIRNPFLARDSRLAHSMLKPSRSRDATLSPCLPRILLLLADAPFLCRIGERLVHGSSSVLQAA
jgi:hypothetical protein